jgi:hypothetical protein
VEKTSGLLSSDESDDEGVFPMDLAAEGVFPMDLAAEGVFPMDLAAAPRTRYSWVPSAFRESAFCCK